MTSFETKRHERHSLSRWRIIHSRQLDHWTGLRGDLWHSKAEEEKTTSSRRQTTISGILPSRKHNLTLDVVDARDQGSAPSHPCQRGRRADGNQRTYGEADKARTRAGHRAIDGTLLRRNASEVKSYISAPALSTTHPRGHRDRREASRIRRRDPVPILPGQEGIKEIRPTSRVRPSAEADCPSTTS